MQSNRNHAQPSQKVGLESMYFQHHDYSEPTFFSNNFNFQEPFDFPLQHYDQQRVGYDFDRWSNAIRPQILPEEDLIPMPFLDHLNDGELAFLAAFDGPEPSVHEMLEILADPPATTLAGPHPVTSMPGPMMVTPNMAAQPMTAPTLAASNMAAPTMAGPFNHAPMPTNFNQPSTSTDHHSLQTTANAINAPLNTSNRPQRTAQRVTKLRKSCNRCHGRKLKCVIVEGAEPKVCTECAIKGLTCIFEEKKQYTRKSAT